MHQRPFTQFCLQLAGELRLDYPVGMNLEIRLLTESDIPFGMQLKSTAGWNQSREDWRRFLALCRDGCFVAECNGVPVGTATTTPYGDRFGWVGMVLVLPEYRRRGIGTVLLKHAIAALEGRGVGCVRLDATPLGKCLYDTMGFRDEYPLQRMEGVAVAVHGAGALMIAEDLEAVVAFDRDRFGADRSSMVDVLWRQVPELCFVVRTAGGSISGYVMARPGEHAFQIGPWVATDPATAEALMGCVLGRLAGRRVFLDVPLIRPEPAGICARHGFTTQRPFIRMYRGELRQPGRPEETYAICGVETG